MFSNLFLILLDNVDFCLAISITNMSILQQIWQILRGKKATPRPWQTFSVNEGEIQNKVWKSSLNKEV